jgi:hypothetical protein
MMPPQTDEQREAYSKLAPIRDRAMITDYIRQFDPGRRSSGLAPGTIERQRQLPNPPPPVDTDRAVKAGVLFRVEEILRRHIRVEDAKLSDHELITAVTARYMAAREVPILDPNE